MAPKAGNGGFPLFVCLSSFCAWPSVLCIEAPASAEIEVKRSRFLAEIFPVFSQKEARERLKSQKERHKGASHVVHAFALGSGQVCGCSDDGEPSGTAGRPALNVLKGAGLTDCMITVARWFGGTLLGTGGLARAYAAAAKAALSRARTRERAPLRRFAAKVPYPLLGSFLRCAEKACAIVYSRSFADASPIIEGAVPEENADSFREACAALSSGRIRLDIFL